MRDPRLSKIEDNLWLLCSHPNNKISSVPTYKRTQSSFFSRLFIKVYHNDYSDEFDTLCILITIELNKTGIKLFPLKEKDLIQIQLDKHISTQELEEKLLHLSKAVFEQIFKEINKKQIDEIFSREKIVIGKEFLHKKLIRSKQPQTLLQLVV